MKNFETIYNILFAIEVFFLGGDSISLILGLFMEHGSYIGKVNAIVGGICSIVICLSIITYTIFYHIEVKQRKKLDKSKK